LRWLRACEAEDDRPVELRAYLFVIVMLALAAIINLS
jgi:hypothetical protein